MKIQMEIPDSIVSLARIILEGRNGKKPTDREIKTLVLRWIEHGSMTAGLKDLKRQRRAALVKRKLKEIK